MWGQVVEGSAVHADGGLHAMSGISLRNLRETISEQSSRGEVDTFCSLITSCISLIVVVVALFIQKLSMLDT